MKNTKVGIAFGEHIKTERLSRYSNSERRNASNPKVRGFLFPLALLLVFGIIVIKLITLQLFQGSYYKTLSNTNRTLTTIIHAPRGIIFDRHKAPLVYNIPGFRITTHGKTQFLSQEEALPLLAANNKSLEIDTLRQYPYSDAFAHVLGYLGEISQDELANPLYTNYQSGDVIGQMGIEQQYEQILKGTDGKKLSEVDATGKITRTLGQTDPIAGQDITLTLDEKLQLAVYNAMSSIQKGAVIVSTPQGEILALVSKPTFDPNLFTLGKSYKTASSSSYQSVSEVLLDGQNQPLLNRAISGVYPPGSTFKIVNASAGLEDNVINQDFTITDTGTITIGAFSFSNWYYTQYGRTDGSVNVVKAIQRSNDIFFYKLADLIGVDRLSQFAQKFGLGSQLGIDLPGEASGLVPTKEWKLSVLHEPWYLGDTYHYGIGQGFLLTTPLQVNTLTQVIANGGNLYRPHLLLGKNANKYKVTNKQIIAEKNIDLIREGMIDVCSPGGVAYPLFNYQVKNPKLTIDNINIMSVASASADFRHIALACKTGTAQQGGISENPHAWITLFAPAYKPQIVVTVLSEASGEGSDIAAPVAKKILDYWFTR